VTAPPRCEAFERWLDAGSPGEGAVEARAHAATCARCAAALAAMNDIDAILAVPAPAAAGDFTDRVMRRVAQVSAARSAAFSWVEEDEALPWWVAAAAQPATLFAAALAALVMWRKDALLAGAAAAVHAAGSAWQATSGAAASWLAPLATLGLPSSLAVQTGIALALLPVLLLLSLRLEVWSERLIDR
jgi:hypothetical protein